MRGVRQEDVPESGPSYEKLLLLTPGGNSLQGPGTMCLSGMVCSLELIGREVPVVVINAKFAPGCLASGGMGVSKVRFHESAQGLFVSPTQQYVAPGAKPAPIMPLIVDVPTTGVPPALRERWP